MNIAKADREELQSLLGLIEAYWRFEGIEGFDAARIRPVLERLLDEPRLGAIWIARLEGRAVGYLVATYSLSLEFMGLVAEVDEFFVAAEARQHGLGQALFQAAEQELRRVGCASVSLQLSRQNETARRFYSRLGFGPRSGYELLDKPLTIDATKA